MKVIVSIAIFLIICFLIIASVLGLLLKAILTMIVALGFSYLLYRFACIRQERKLLHNIEEKLENQKMIYLTDGKEVKIKDDKREEMPIKVPKEIKLKEKDKKKFIKKVEKVLDKKVKKKKTIKKKKKVKKK